jgi:hypothetical protein
LLESDHERSRPTVVSSRPTRSKVRGRRGRKFVELRSLFIAGTGVI